MPVREVPGARIHYRLDGPEDAPVVVLGNSLGTALAMWEGQLPAMTRSFRVLRFDLRGHGASSASTEPVDISVLGRDVLSLLDDIGVKSVCFLGLSLGGMIALWLSAHVPERLDKLVLANTAAVIGPATLWGARIAAVARGGMAGIVDAVLERWFTAEFRARQPERVDCLRRMLLATSPAGYAVGCAAVRDADLRAIAASVRAPTLVISGRRDRATPPAEGRWLAQHIPSARYLELDAAHLSNVEAESAFNESVVGFLTAQGG